ncbi:hypothetical protein [Hyphobacterium sp.]|jgi:hypothetical protein|uniref:hypothetical protein n=1 Tax=Hyphobacterium sp. TaxID=2004662 RepID=UPI003BAC3AD8
MTTPAHGIRFAIFQLLLAVFFVCIAFLVDARWGDDAVTWLVVGYAVANGLVVATWFGGFVRRAQKPDTDVSPE